MEFGELWKTALADIEINISRASFLTWFKDTSVVGIDEGRATVSVPNGFVKEWLQNKYNKFILRAIRNINSEVKEVSYIIGKPQTNQKDLMKKALVPLPKTVAAKNEASLSSEFELKDLNIDPETSLNPKYTFDSFIVGTFNELAHAASKSIVTKPGIYNPLFIYGGVGLGKTHLVQAVGNEIIKQNPKTKVKYMSSEKFMGEIVEALRNQDIGQLKEKYRAYDFLIMDDIQFIAKTEKMQEEFFHTFNALYEKNKQIVISSDRPPAAIATLEDRLKSRFEGGMIADIGEPDYETRLTILKVKAEKSGFVVPEDILEHVAHTIKNNIRELEGALNRIILMSKMNSTVPSLEDVKKMLNQIIYAPRKFVTPKKVIKAVSDFYDLGEKEILNKSRKKEIVKPRQIVMYLLRDELKCSFPFIGEKIGKKDHTTAIHAYKKILADLKSNLDLEEEIKLIKEKIYSS